jgi:hypothetical protein
LNYLKQKSIITVVYRYLDAVVASAVFCIGAGGVTGAACCPAGAGTEAAIGEFACVAAASGLLFVIGALCIIDLLFFADKTAKLRQVIKKTTERTVVVLVRKVLVFVPNIDSIPENPETNPPPRPACTRIITISNKQAIMCTDVINTVIFLPRWNF